MPVALRDAGVAVHLAERTCPPWHEPQPSCGYCSMAGAVERPRTVMPDGQLFGLSGTPANPNSNRNCSLSVDSR